MGTVGNGQGINSEVAPGLKVITIERARLTELFVTATPTAPADRRDLLAAALGPVRAAAATVVAVDVFGLPPAAGIGRDWPVTWLTSGPGAAPGLAGVQVQAVRGTPVERLEQGGRVVGSVFADGLVRHCRLAGVQPPVASAAPAQQARATFELLEAALRSAGMDFTNVARTWFYLDRILAWYDSFNQVRDEFFRARKVFDARVPASTGVGGANTAGRALLAGAYAVQSPTASVKLRAVPSPLQCPALHYGSSFSRALELETPDHYRLWISGTASIDANGRTVQAGHPTGQIELTMNVVGTILESRGLTWRDATRAVAYLKDASLAPLFQDYRATHGLDHLPVVTTHNDICRPELLFELELDAGRGR